jgi:peptidoglycan/LPS O-acetylase OafA/YrhL
MIIRPQAVGVTGVKHIPSFRKYLGADLLFLNFLAPSLPGVFPSNPLSAVNGALWTLKIEVVFYLFVPVMHYLCIGFGTRNTMAGIFCLSCLWKYGFAFLDSLRGARGVHALGNSRSIYAKLEVQFPAHLVYFSAGILLLLYFDKLKSHCLAISCITAALFFADQFLAREILDVFGFRGWLLSSAFGAS